MTRRTVAIVQARMGSQRLPGKVLMDIAGRPMYEHVCRRAAAAPGIDAVWLCVAENSENEPLIVDARNRALMSEHPGTAWRLALGKCEPPDVLGLFAELTGDLPLDTVLVRLTADCPLIDPMIIAAVARRHQPGCLTSSSVTDKTGLPDGMDAEAFDVATLFNAAAVGRGAAREHVTAWMREGGAPLQLVWEGDVWPRSAPIQVPVKLSVDTIEELNRARDFHQVLGPGLWGLPAVEAHLQRAEGQP